MNIKVKLTRQSNKDYCGRDEVTISLEAYVAGVVASEIGNANIEACKAMAVAARTNAYPYYSKDKAISDSSSAVQAFRAERVFTTEYMNAGIAALQTEGQLLTYNGAVCQPCSFSSNNGGRTTSSESRWGGYRAWLIEQDDPWDHEKKTGHGVGMSQAGAKYAASIGKTYEEILSFYYPNTTLKKGDETPMAKVSAKQFVETAEKIYKTHKVTYQNGMCGTYSGGTWLCDCRGYIIWTLRTLGLNVSSTGTNWMIRKQMTEVHQIKNVNELHVGQVVFKSKTDTSNMPDRYRKGRADYSSYIGEIDVYHIGIVLQTSPSLIIRHCTSGGIKTDTVLGKWNWAGWIQWVEPEVLLPVDNRNEREVANDHMIVIGNGRLNMRKGPAKTYDRVVYLNPGDVVVVLDQPNDSWCHVQFGKYTGYVNRDFLSHV